MKSVFVVITVICMIMSFTLYSEANPPDGLVLHLSFDNNTIDGDTVQDLSEEGNDGTINGGAKVVDGKHGEALEFDGTDDFVEVPLVDSITFSTGDSLTVQVWVKTDDQPPQNDGIVGNYRPGTEALWLVSISGDDPAARGKMGFSVRDKGRANSASVRSTDFLNDNEWHVLAGVRDQKAKKLRFYVDGELINEVDDKTLDINSGQSIWVGEHLNRFYKGLIDEVKVWNRPLTENELQQSGQQPSSVDAVGKLTTTWGIIKARLQ
ncbi:MAG: LamG domain-containing protein [Candidatus Poribacteria bacterium]|nr:LamG domain-containing protein [Candidatus Poribacteria bacterium]